MVPQFRNRNVIFVLSLVTASTVSCVMQRQPTLVYKTLYLASYVTIAGLTLSSS